MKDIKEKLNPFIDIFVKELAKIREIEQDKIKELEKQTEETVEEQKSLRAKQTENERILQKRLNDLSTEIDAQNKLQSDLTNETSRYNRLNHNLEAKVGEAAIALKNAKLTEKLISEELERKKEEIRNYQRKTELLKMDSDKLIHRDKELNGREDKIRAKEKIQLGKDGEFIERNHVLDEKKLDLSLREKRIKFEEKKLKLNEWNKRT